MRLIERGLPIEKLNTVAMAEGNAKKPIYRMHKWWARRLGSVFRMITLATFSPDTESELSAWHKFCDGFDLGGRIVLDPFMGGGTTVVESLRLGCKVVGLDINPVAWFVTKKEAEPVEIGHLDAAFDELERSVGQRVAAYYTTSCPAGHHATVMYFFWVKVADCRRCGAKVRLFPNYELSRRDHTNISVCPQCMQINETAGYLQDTRCRECGISFDPRGGVSGKGIFHCPQCGERQRLLDAVERRSAALSMELHALEGYCVTCGRFFKRVDDNDLLLWQQAKTEFERRRASLLIPHQLIPTEGRSDPRPVNHGYTHFWQLFNERQLLGLSMLLEQILSISDQNIRELMLIAFSDCLDANNMFCKYEIEWHKVSLMFGLHAYHPIERPAENNVWGTAFGRGTFVKCFEKVRRAKLYCQHPHERLSDLRGRRYSKHTDGEHIAGRLVDDFGQMLRTDHAALLRCQSSEDLSFLPDKVVDVVITDPPYFDNVQYSELADFFYVWLRLGLRTAYSWFEPELSSHPREIVKNDELGKTTEFFNEGLQQVFSQCHRVLKDEGLLIFTFHHNKTWAWEGIGRLLLGAGFYVSATPIVRSEGKSGFHSSEGNIRYDCVLVCRKAPSQTYGAEQTAVIKELILSDAVCWTQRTLDSGMPVNEVDIFTIVMGKTIEHYTKAIAVAPCLSRRDTDVRKGADGRQLAEGRIGDAPLSLSEALEEMAGVVDEIGAMAAVERYDTSRLPVGSATQLALLLVESRAEYGNAVGKRPETEPDVLLNTD